MVEGVGDEGGREGEGTLEHALGHVGDGLGGLWEARGGVSARFREVWGWANGGTVSLVEKIGINSERTLYTRPVHRPAPPHCHFRGFGPLVPSWSLTVATCCVVKVVGERNCWKGKSTLVDASRRSRDLTKRAEQNAELCW